MPCVLCFYIHTKYYYNFSGCFQVRKNLAIALHTELIWAKYRSKIPKIFKNTETVYHVSTRSFLLLTAYREFTGRNTSSKRKHNRNFQGQPSGWNWLIIVMCSSTDTKSCSPIPTFVWLSILDFVAFYRNITFTFTCSVFVLFEIYHDNFTVKNHIDQHLIYRHRATTLINYKP